MDVLGVSTDSGDGVTLHGIRVLWMIKFEDFTCQQMNLTVELNHGEFVNDSSAEFHELACNRHYRPSVKATLPMFTVEDFDQ